VERRESPHTLRAFGRIGHRNFAHCTSTGKVLLANLTDDELRRTLPDAKLEARTPYTITDRSLLMVELQRVRKAGHAENVNEGEVGLASVAAPIRDASGRVIAAISVAGPAARLEGETMRRFAAATADTAAAISERLGHRPDRLQLRSARSA
jgi:DNA-binding IclR family transcriptional regulator